MRFLPAITLILIGSAGLSAQSTTIYPPIQINYQDLKTYLNLSDTQLQSLETIQTNKNQAQQAIFQQINTKQQQLNALLNANSSDATQIGQLTIDINNLRKQLPLPLEPYHSQAVAVLTPDQQSKLAALTTALQLGSAASQAVILSLIAPLPPRPNTAVPLMGVLSPVPVQQQP